MKIYVTESGLPNGTYFGLETNNGKRDFQDGEFYIPYQEDIFKKDNKVVWFKYPSEPKIIKGK